MLLKRLFDILLSVVGLLLLLPLFFVTIIFIKIKMPGPIFFYQKRFGRFGQLFALVKFRTMTLNHDGSSISIKGENRITPFGVFLRKHKIDELPELWNVLKGDMSFVGPRPDLPKYAERLIGEERRILELRPGITGPASLKYANEEELLASLSNPQEYNDEVIWPDKVNLNMNYYNNRSFMGDIRIMLQTIFVRNKNSHTCPTIPIV